jgi:hypothetical protein
MKKKCIDITARDCGWGDWLGIVTVDGCEVYRTGNHKKGRLLAFEAAMEWLDKSEYSEV